MSAPSSSEPVQVGRLRFTTGYRRFGSDHGPVVEVYAEVKPGEWREVARYDCFVQEPHRHFFHRMVGRACRSGDDDDGGVALRLRRRAEVGLSQHP